MSNRKASLMDLKIEVRQKIKIVNFEPMDIVILSNLFMETGRAEGKNRSISLECFAKAWYYRKWVKPLVTAGKDWNDKKPIDLRHLIGMENKDAMKLYNFIHVCIRALKEIPTDNAENIRTKLIAYNKLINDTIKICERGI